MIKRPRVVQGLLVGGAIVAATAAPALAATVDPNGLTINDGGGNEWDIDNFGGTDTGAPTPGSDCSEAPGFTLDDAELASDSYDAYDNAAMIWINGEVFANPDDSVERTDAGSAITITSDTVSYSGLDATMSYTFLADNTETNGIARTLLTLSNPTGAPIDATVDFVNNFGSDDATYLFRDQTDDGQYTAADRWIVTTDDPEYSGDPINTTVFFGPGDVASAPVDASDRVFDCAGDEGAWDTFETTVPAGGVQHYVFFNMITQAEEDQVLVPAGGEELATPQASPPNAAVDPYLAQFDVPASASNPLFAGIPADQIPNIVNWSPAQAPTTTTTTTTAPAPAPTTTAPPMAVTATPRFTG